MSNLRPGTAGTTFIAISVLILVALFMLRASAAGAGEGSCVSYSSAAAEAIAFTDGLADRGTAQIEADVTGTFEWYSIDAPMSLVPRMKHDRRYRKTGRNFGHYVAYSPRRLLRFKQKVGSVPVKLGAIAFVGLGRDFDGERIADFSYSGRVLGKAAWRRQLQMAGKGAINCDGTIRVWSMGIIGGSTPWRRQASVCKERRVVATVKRTRVCKA